MEFGYFAQTHVPLEERERDPSAEHRRLMNDLEASIAAEQFGFKYVWASEHHFLDEYSHMSCPEVFLSFVAARTERIHVGSAITNTTPPVNHPARVAERVAMLDHLTEGRFEFGTGRGSSSTEQQGFGIAENSLTRDMWDETIAEFPRMWRESSYEHDGTYFSMPPRNVLPKPYGRSHPAMWVACGNPPTFEKAGRLGLGAQCFSHGSPRDHLAPLIETYKKAVAQAEPVGEFVNDNVLCVSTLVCTENREDAFEIVSRAGSSRYTGLLYRYLDTFPRPEGVPAWPTLLPDPTPDDVRVRSEAGLMCVGDPDDCARVVQAFADAGADQLVFSPLTSTVPLEVALASMDLFGREVLGLFDKDPEHRTSRMRDGAAAT